ncbi:MAG TPA: hypothetical protein VFK47_22895, partial [Ktedonobacteraceae bacterium]|nr:hypothetical protein [Ktedonobacteraceae bacterium]
MVPEAFHDYFVASTGAGAALVGLPFVAVSIAPERTMMSGAPVERQAVATSGLYRLAQRLLSFAGGPASPDEPGLGCTHSQLDRARKPFHAWMEPLKALAEKMAQ